MKDTGIVRRIDELGRIVIPKEMRKTLRLKVGDPLEISTEAGQLFLKKYSPLKSLNNYALDICESLYQLTQNAVIITDNEQVLASKGQIKREKNEKISIELENVIDDRKSLYINKNEGGELRKVVENDDLDFISQLIVPIICNGDALGTIILLSNKDDKPISQDSIKLVQFAEDFISRQFQ